VTDLTPIQSIEDSLAHGARPVVPGNAGDTFYDPASRSVWMRLPKFSDHQVVAHLEAVLELLGQMKSDQTTLHSLWLKLDDLTAKSEDVGGWVYRAFAELQRGAELQLDELEHRKQNGGV
jgi:hypothetical protein